MYKQASKQKLRFPTDRGLVTVEDLWDLSLEKLNVLAVAYNRKINESSEVSFLEESTVEDKTAKLCFDIVIDIMNEKRSDNKKRASASMVKAEKELLLDVLDRKKKESLESLSVEELTKRISELG